MGSGKLIRYAINKYGINNFSKEYLGIYDTEKEMNLAERILVVIDSEVSYNLCSGGQGGFGYINSNQVILSKRDTKENKLKGYNSVKDKLYLFPNKGMSGHRHSSETLLKMKTSNIRSHSEETKKKMSETKRGKKTGQENSQFGTCWVNNGIENKKIHKGDVSFYLELRYSLGRKMKF